MVRSSFVEHKTGLWIDIPARMRVYFWPFTSAFVRVRRGKQFASALVENAKKQARGEHQGWSAAQTPLIQRTWAVTQFECEDLVWSAGTSFRVRSGRQWGEHQDWSAAPTPLIQRAWLSTKLVCRHPMRVQGDSQGEHKG